MNPSPQGNSNPISPATQFGVGPVPYHTHNGIDSPMISSGAASVNYNSGVSSKDLSQSSTTQTIAHGLGSLPGFLKISAFFGNGSEYLWSFGSYNNTNTALVYGATIFSGSGNTHGDTAHMIIIQDLSANGQTATVTLDSVNINITWTKTGSGSGTCNFMWEVYG